MNAPEKAQADGERLDLLVDGELGEAERMELLRGLEGQPGGWRRCALAFLEAQSWRDGFGALAGEAGFSAAGEQETAPRMISPPGRFPRKLAHRTAAGSAMAASFLLALWVGWAVQDRGQTGQPLPTIQGDLAESVPLPGTSGPVEPSLGRPSQRPVGPRGPWQMVTLSTNGPDGRRAQTIDLPACDRRLLDSQWPESLPSALPCEVMESLERSGYRVRRRRELIPIEMPDGRRLVVPIEQIEVQYVGQPPL